MLRDRYTAMNLFELVPALGMAMEPVLTKLDVLLEDDTLFQAVKADLLKRRPRTRTDGRPSTPVEVILRMLVVKHLYGWSYEETERWVSDSLVLRQFCRVYAHPVPDDTVLIRWANLIQPVTLHRLLDHMVDLARQHTVTRGRKLRVDSTVVATNIHHPVDSTLLTDGVRVLSRLLTKAKHLAHTTVEVRPVVLRDRTRSAITQMQQIMDAARHRGEQAEQGMRCAYQRLLTITQATVQQAQQMHLALSNQTTRGGQRVQQALQQFLPRVQQVIEQTRRRVLEGAQVPASDKIVSLFETHTAIIRKGKPGKPVEFGRVVWLDEVEGGLITRYAILAGNPNDADQFQPSLDHHRQCFAYPPTWVVGDRKIYSPENEAYATNQGVKRVVLPKPGTKSQERITHERQRWFRRGRNWRAGIEGRISGLKRAQKLDRCLYPGEAGMERWVGWGIIAHELQVIAHKLVA